MRYIYIILLSVMLSSCGGANPALDHIETTTEQLQPIADNFQKLCIITKKCSEAAGEDIAEITEICKTGWSALKTIQALQESAVKMLGGDPCGKSCNPSSK